MDPLVFLTCLAVPVPLVAWLYGEWRGGATMRRVAAIALVALIAIASYHVGWLGPQYSITWYELSLDRIREMAQAGDTDGIAASLVRYRSTHKLPEPDSAALLRELTPP
jgi:hypothetical protein